MPAVVLIIAAFLLVACNKEPEATAPPEAPPVVFEGLRIQPEQITIESGPNRPGRVQFEVTGTTADGEELPLDRVSWELSNQTAGTVDEQGTFRASTANGGITWLTASLDGMEATATITVRYVEEIEHEDVDSALFDVDPEVPVNSAWLYPEDGTAFPRNTPSIHWQWTDPTTLPDAAPGPALAYRVSFQSELTEITWYTPDRELILDATTWARIASSNAGGEVEVTLETALADRVVTEAPIKVRVQRMDATGSVIYWSTTANGLVEIPFGDQARDFLTRAQTGRCVGCHAISKDRLISFAWDGGNGALGVRDLETGYDLPSSGGGNFSTFSPDGTKLLVASYGNLMLKDPWTGDDLGTPLASGNASHPDWAPDNSGVVFTWSGGHSSDWTIPTTTKLGFLPYLGNGIFGTPEVLYEAPAGQRAYYPSWSPDSQFIAFNVSAGDCYDDPDAELWVMHRSGTLNPIRLDNANKDVNLTNSWPRWGPLPDDDVLWLAFASRRPYGAITTTTPQIWVTAIDPLAIQAGVDPSTPAFWLPGQDSGTGNHIPVWVE